MALFESFGPLLMVWLYFLNRQIKLFNIYSPLLTDSSAEASALGSGPRGRRFKSALSENLLFLLLCHFPSIMETKSKNSLISLRNWGILYHKIPSIMETCLEIPSIMETHAQYLAMIFPSIMETSMFFIIF